MDLKEFTGFLEREGRGFSYNACKLLYCYFGMGKKLVNSLPKLSLASKREIFVDDSPEEVKDAFIKACEYNKIDKVALDAAILSRIYGMSGILMMDGDRLADPVKKSISRKNIQFNVLDPLCFNTVINQDPLSPAYLKPSSIRVGSAAVDKSRFYVCFNGRPIYIEFQNSAFNFSGQSVFANMRRYIVAYPLLYNALENIAMKASSILIKNDGSDGAGGMFMNPNDVAVSKQSLGLFKRLKQAGVAILGRGQSAEFFNLSGVSEIKEMVEIIMKGFAYCLEDTPSSLLLDENLSNGLSEGVEDMKAVVMAVNSYRENVLNDIYRFLDSFIFYKAWDEDFIKEMQIKYPQDYAGLGINQIREKWIKGYSFKWSSVYPKTQDEETKEKDGVLTRLEKAKNIGVGSDSLKEILNASDVFPVEVDFDNFNQLYDESQQYIDDLQDDGAGVSRETKKNI